jgi:serine/threonine-protein kinase HipA
LATEHAPAVALAGDYLDEERAFAGRLRDFVVSQASRLTALVIDAAKVKDSYL